MSLLDECVAYFQQPEFQRLIIAWVEKYKRLGYLGGKIKLDELSKKEQEAFGLLLGMDLSSGFLHITYAQFLKKIQQTKFENIDFLDVIKCLQETPIYTHQELKNMKKDKEETFKQSLLQDYQGTSAYQWLHHYLYESHQVTKNIHSNPQQFYIQLNYVCQALNHLPIINHQYLLLSVFSQLITKDPHYFDHDPVKEMFIKGIAYCLEIPLQDKSIEYMNELFYHAGLLRDDLSNNCYICHIRPIKNLMGWVGFYQNYEPWNMNLYNLTQVSSLFYPMPIYIIENPSVFRSLVDVIKQRELNVGLICSNGQINLCTYMLLDQLTRSGCHLYYAGDYDPEGLLIADKLKQRYQEALSLWCYDIQYFDGNAVEQQTISQKRQRILKNIHNQQLKNIAEYMIEKKVFAYQEGFIDIYINVIKSSDKK